MNRTIAAFSIGAACAFAQAQAPLPKFRSTVLAPLSGTGSFFAQGLSEGGIIYGGASRDSDLGQSYAAIITGDTVRVLPRVNAWSQRETVLGVDAEGRIFGRSHQFFGLGDSDEDWVIEPGAATATPLSFQFAGVNRYGLVAGNLGQVTVTWKGGTIRSTLRHESQRPSALGIADDGTVSGIDPGHWVIRNGVLIPLPELYDTAHTGITPSGRLFGSSFFQYGQGYTYSLTEGLKYYKFPHPILTNTFFDRDLPYVVASGDTKEPFLHFNGRAYSMVTLLEQPNFGVSGWVRGMNSRGQVLVDNGGILYLLTPVPEPATMTALAVGALALVRKRRKA